MGRVIVSATAKVRPHPCHRSIIGAPPSTDGRESGPLSPRVPQRHRDAADVVTALNGSTFASPPSPGAAQTASVHPKPCDGVELAFDGVAVPHPDNLTLTDDFGWVDRHPDLNDSELNAGGGGTLGRLPADGRSVPASSTFGLIGSGRPLERHERWHRGGTG